MFDYTTNFNDRDDFIDVENVEETVEEDDTKLGKVDCDLLNIRPEANTNGDPVTQVKRGEELLIMSGLDDRSDWYYICTAAGIEGYVMKRFVVVD